jgi:hypothetical protein
MGTGVGVKHNVRTHPAGGDSREFFLRMDEKCAGARESGRLADATLPRTLPQTIRALVASHTETGGEADGVSPQAQGLWPKLVRQQSRMGCGAMTRRDGSLRPNVWRPRVLSGSCCSSFQQFTVKIAVKSNFRPELSKLRACTFFVRTDEKRAGEEESYALPTGTAPE